MGRDLPHEVWRSLVQAAQEVEEALRSEMAYRFRCAVERRAA
jgi:hypothetical protein